MFLLAVLRAGPAPAPPGSQGGPVEGLWHTARTVAGSHWGSVGEHPVSFRIPAGLVADGERVRVLPGSAPKALARGPVLPAGTGPPPRRDLRADELVRLARAPGGPSPALGIRTELMRRAGPEMIYMLKSNSRHIDHGTPEDVRRELLQFRELHEQYPGIITYCGGRRLPENVQAFNRYYQEYLVYGTPSTTP